MATQMIRKLYSTQYPELVQPVIVALTANAVAGDREYYLAHEMDLYISKPLIRQDLVDAIADAKALLRHRQGTLLPESGQ